MPGNQFGRGRGTRGIVDDDDFIAGRVVQRNQRVQAQFQAVGPVAGRNDDADEGRIGQQRCLLLNTERPVSEWQTVGC